MEPRHPPPHPVDMMRACIAATLVMCPFCADAQDPIKDVKPAAAAGFLKTFDVDSLSFAPLPFQSSYHLPQTQPHKFFKSFRLDSFGYSSAPVMPAYEFSPVTTSDSFYNLRGLDCPTCAMGPPNRTRTTLQPFGATAAVNFWHGRMQIYASYGGTESWRPDGMMQGIGRQLLSPLGGINGLKPVRPNLSPLWGGGHLISDDQYNDAWLVQAHAGFRFFLDRRKNIALGVSEGAMYNFSPFGAPRWTSTSADLSITFGNGPAKFIARRLRRIFRERTQGPDVR